MNVIIAKNYDELSRQAAQLVAQKIKNNPKLVLGLATGSTPVGLYQGLIELFKQKKIDFQKITTFNLDEYVGLAPDHPQSYHFFMQKNLFDHVNVPKERVFIPNGQAPDLEKECISYEQNIQKQGGIDIQILGIGRDGHIGFNEPGSSIDSRTRVVSLDVMTVNDNARFFQQDISLVPKQAVTMGIATILAAKECLLLANGAHKADIILQTLYGPITESIPASFLQKHENLTVILDKEAAGKLSENLKSRGIRYEDYSQKTGGGPLG